ncbi:uncharacterized protein K460DRAFT_285948 [Cucurbitaria berberidis CBS 394.84]|uniref:C3H1-type domain-containing protein n=1 Tax=Cucurbitaria berberidis CBS 394.84 TaxID=1168544 RepID=A0A9P4GGK7_9PLEO|nr:uncharacterized protein K460DRAFT_285948 [Cucurbitaria berberidis CBS 394.84]KAF1845237.1 hypothetical protein K460DRAFT_285948 [Cucurbitaria berberidis CBS 394.84]
MASNHVPSDQVPMQGQNVYADPSYPNFFSSVDRYGPSSWEQLNNQTSGLAPPTSSSQSWHQGSFTQQQQQPPPFNALSQPYGSQTHGLRTASPYQYGQFGQPTSTANYAQQASNVDPSLSLDPNALRQQQQSPYQMPMRTATPQGQSGTVTPQALQHNTAQLHNIRPAASPFQIPKSTSELFSQQRAIPTPLVKPVRVPEYEIPKGRKSGGLYVLDPAALAKATKSNALNKFVTLGSEPFHLATNRTALPLYTARLSLKDLKKAGAGNKKLAKLSSSKSSLSRPFKSERKTASSPSGLTREVSDSESYTESSDDDSEYSDDEVEEQSPLPASRPEEPHAAVRYDVIKATWYPRASPVGSEKIKNSMRDIWEVLNTIQKRWRADSKAVSEAEEQKKTGELPVLKSRVASQRDLLQSALKAALELAHPDVLYHLGQIKPFLYLCYQFLANRFHSKDYDGPLAAVIFEILSRCGTLTSELLEETKVIKALVSMKKHANEKHRAFIQQVVDGAATNTKKAKANSPPGAEPTEAKGAKRPAADSGTRATSEGPVAKRPKPAESLATATKKDNVKSTTATSGSVPLKRPGEKPATAPIPVKARVNQVSNKPSGIFASLNAASKKPTAAATAPTSTKVTAPPRPTTTVATRDKKPTPTTASKPAFSFAQTMASLMKPKEQEAVPAKSEKQLPPESAEEKAKRLRKESRRHLRVTFRPDTSLVSIRYFDHAPEEDMGHEENFVRDAGDIGGEGRMFKQHKELDVDEDEDDAEMDHQPWREPSRVDFSVIPPDERQRNYMPFGGGENQPSCPEREANVRRENATLMVFYSHPSDIPSSPREPLEESTPAVTVTNFGPPPDVCLQRCPQVSVPATVPDLSNLENIFKQFANPSTSQAPAIAQPAPVENTYVQPALPTPAVDLASILSALNGQNASQPPPPAPIAMQAPVQPSMPAGLDFNAMMALIQAQAATGGALPPPPPGLPPGFPPFPFSFPPPQQDTAAAAYQPQMQQQQQQQYDQQPNGGMKRQRDDVNSNAERGQGKRHKNRSDRPHKVLACKFFQKGTCNKGDNCTYIHDLNM